MCTPAPSPPEVATLCALIDHYRQARAAPGDRLVVAFYGGAPPPLSLVDALGGLSFRIRVRPDLLSRRAAEVYIERGAEEFELDVLSFDDALVRRSGRAHRRGLIRLMAEGFARVGVRCSMVLTPGLPGWSFDQCVEDAAEAAEWADAVRLLPVLVLRHSRLAESWRGGFYEPLSVPAAVEICSSMMDILESRGVEVRRVGLQPGPDEAGRAIAGPVHSSLRELVEAKRMLDRLRGICVELPRGAVAEIRCHPADETRVRGALNQNIRTLRAEFSLAEVLVSADPEVDRGIVEVASRHHGVHR